MAKIEVNNTPEPEDDLAAEAHVHEIMDPSEQTSAENIDSTEKSAPADDLSVSVSEDGTLGTAPELESAEFTDDTEPAGIVAADTEKDLTDPATDKAVDDIAKHEGDEILEAQDAAAEKAVVMKSTRRERFKNAWANWWGNPKKRYGTIGGIIVVIGLLLAVPFTRYEILGLFLKEQITVTAVDSKTGAPVSGASVLVGGKQAKTEANGKATVAARLGKVTLDVSKQYYQPTSQGATVTFSKQHNAFKVPLLALGRKVPVKVVNVVTGKPLANASLNVQGSQTKTNKDGLATVVLASAATSQKASVSLSGYNTASVNITVANSMVSANTFNLTPSGKIYFLSNLSGKIDVVKTNLDGTGRQTVLAGTGNEDASTTSLLASRDWKYLALESKRGGNTASIYLIDTTNGDKLTTIDQGDATYNLVGWSGDTFAYQVTRNNVSNWQPNQQALKSYDATNGNLVLLDQTAGSGTGQTDWVKQSFGSPYLIGDQLVYAKNWEASYYGSPDQLAGKTAELDSIGVNGSGHKVVKSFALDPGTQSSDISISTKLYEPDGLYIYFASGTKDNFYVYDKGQLNPDTTLTSDQFWSGAYPTYLLSPSGNQTFWSEQRDGKNTLLVGDEDGQAQKPIASLSDYNTYGWYTDNYLLVSKNSSELYIMPSAGGTPLKISDYYKPAISYAGYGGGYGGL